MSLSDSFLSERHGPVSFRNFDRCYNFGAKCVHFPKVKKAADVLSGYCDWVL